LPTWMIYDDVVAGRLAVLDLEPYPVRAYKLHAFYRADSPPGPAGRWLIERFKQELPKVCANLPDAFRHAVAERQAGANDGSRAPIVLHSDGADISPSRSATRTAR